MKTYLSHGGGVNSTALMLLLEKEGVEFESVFVDHGGDYPDTYQYINYLQKMGHPISVIKPYVSGCLTIEQYALKYHIIPARWQRWCTQRFKIIPLNNYFEKPCVNLIGIDASEKHRTLYEHQKQDKRIKLHYPLVERKITRQGCIRIIKEGGLEVPPRSGCWFCPFMSYKAIRKLYVNYPDLYERMKRMELNTGRNFYFDQGDHGGRKRPVSSIVAEDTSRLDKFCEGEGK